MKYITKFAVSNSAGDRYGEAEYEWYDLASAHNEVTSVTNWYGDDLDYIYLMEVEDEND